MSTFKINADVPGNAYRKEVEANKHTLVNGYFHFIGAGGAPVYSVAEKMVLTVEKVTDASDSN